MQQPAPQAPISAQQQKTLFLKKVRFFLKECRQNSIKDLKIIRGGHGFALLHSQQQNSPLHSIIEHIFNCPLVEFTKQAHHHGFQIRTPKKTAKKVTLFLSQQKLSEEAFQSDFIEESDKDQQEELKEEKVGREKERGKESSVVSISVLNRNQIGSQQESGENIKEELLVEDKAADCHSSVGKFVKPESMASKLSEVLPLSLNERVLLEKDNYQKCSKLIEGTIVELLEAHKKRKIGEQKEQFLDKVVQIYDMLSDGVENSGGTLKQVSNRQGLKQEDKDEME